MLPPSATLTWRGPAEGPTGRPGRIGPRTTGPEALLTSTAEARAATTELTAETRSTTVAADRLICLGATTELTASIWRVSALTAGDASATTRGFTIWGCTAWTAGAYSTERRSASALGAGAGSSFGGGGGSSFRIWTGMMASSITGARLARISRIPTAPTWTSVASPPVSSVRRELSGSFSVRPGKS